MVTFLALLIFSGFYTGYYTSAKAVLTGHSGLKNAIRENPFTAKRIALVLLLTAWIVSMLYSGIAVGTFQFFILLMTLASLIVLLAPLKMVTIRSASVTFVIGLLIEISNLF